MHRRQSVAFLLTFLLILAPLLLTFSWNPSDLFRLPTEQEPKGQPNVVQKISHRAASDTYQDDLRDDAAWYDADGTPLFYSAWRARPSLLRPEPPARSTIVKYGARVACWPSSGGVWIKQANLVDLDFLHLDRFDDTPRQFNQTAEDEVCTTLKMIGAEWWRLPPAFETRKELGSAQYACATLETCFEPEIKANFLIAWPPNENVACYVLVEHALKNGQGALNWYHNSMNMEERCNAIMGLGGRWCNCKARCPDIKDLDWGSREPGPYACYDAPQEIWEVDDPNRPID